MRWKYLDKDNIMVELDLFGQLTWMHYTILTFKTIDSETTEFTVADASECEEIFTLSTENLLI